MFGFGKKKKPEAPTKAQGLKKTMENVREEIVKKEIANIEREVERRANEGEFKIIYRLSNKLTLREAVYIADYLPKHDGYHTTIKTRIFGVKRDIIIRLDKKVNKKKKFVSNIDLF